MVQLSTLREYLKLHFYYEDGELKREFTHKQWEQGRVLGYTGKRGYKTASILGKRYGLHQLIFLLHHGYLPTLIDHDDRNKLNNRIENLLDRDKKSNALNIVEAHIDNKLNLLGVHQRSDTHKFVAQFRGKRVGEFSTAQEAKKAYDDAKSNAITLS